MSNSATIVLKIIIALCLLGAIGSFSIRQFIMGGPPYSFLQPDAIHVHEYNINHRKSYLSDDTEYLWKLTMSVQYIATFMGAIAAIIYKRFKSN